MIQNVAFDTFKIQNRFRLSFRRWLLGQSGGGTINEYIGADVSLVRHYYSKRFLHGMNWNNYGEIWEIDHLIPLKLFDMSHEDDLKLCFHYKNTFPLLKEDNRIKGAGSLFFAIKALQLSEECDIRNQLITFAENRLKLLDKYLL